MGTCFYSRYGNRENESLQDFDIGTIPFGDIMVAVSTLLIGGLLSKLPNGPLEGAIRRFEGLFYKN